MPFNRRAIKAVIFDYGNTLVEFSPTQVSICDAALAAVLEKHFGPMDRERFRAMRHGNRLAPYAGDPPAYRENNLLDISTNLVRDLYGAEPSPEQLADILRNRFDTFVRIVQAPDGVREVLGRLRKKYRLGLLSNYPDGNAIRASLEATGLARFFHAVVVSADVGYVKPHPLPYETLLKQLRVKPANALLVGDNWVGDIQGGKRAGLQVCLTRQWESYEKFERRAGDEEPDAVIDRLQDLEKLL